MSSSIMLKVAEETDRRVGSRKAITSIYRSAHTIGRLIRDLLDVSRLEAGKLAIEKSRQQVTTLLKDALEAERLQSEQKSLRLEIDVSAVDKLEIDCDRDRVQQVFANLIGNAIKFTEPRGKVAVRAKPHASEVRISVTDSGPGISSVDLPHVFDRFWQAQKTARMGTGLGLSIAKGIVEAHRGRIWVESQIGVGSTFFFTLPLVDKSSQSTRVAGANSKRDQSAGAAPPSTKDSRSSVLVADDDLDVREALAETLEREGYNVAQATNGAEALQYLHRAPAPVAIILDLVMPIMDGWAFLAERGRDSSLKSIPVIVVSGQTGVEGQVASARATFMSKPLLSHRLIEKIHQLGR
jgi:CheY-like chemotaxis protein